VADPTSEIKQAIERAITRRSMAMDAQRGISLPTAGTGQNALGGTSQQAHVAVFATGFDGTNTTMPFSRGISVWGSNDIWTA
jgi:hypothetical protein